jgi:hypothetical protein
MKKQTPITKILIQATAAVIAIAAASPLKAQEALVPSGDFNNDGLMDVAALTTPTTITVSLANWYGGYSVSAILTAPRGQEIWGFTVYDCDGDGDLDVYAYSTPTLTSYYTLTWPGNGDGTFGSPRSRKWSSPKGHIPFF